MKILLTALLSVVFGSFCFAQEYTLDSAWTTHGQQFQVRLEQGEASNLPSNTKMSLFRNGGLLFSDSLWCSSLYMELADMNDDGFDDLLLYQGAGARANETYNLFLYIKEKNTYQKVQRYAEWPNLRKTGIRGVLAATILTGTVEYRFFELDRSGKLTDLGITVEDRSFDGKGYQKGLKKVRRLRH
ncbi:hypothetical protein [Pontibacter actiniarum]|uniref:VCBS repeat-containing protein n=1 Tax=Pontibacter actiniarum TaxID=323450 RepID=A0A1X9YP72_9BACT|nr:hypothetical protein [Pontibacter actiniarum]ARS34669.1 hypothetical protein CA264_03965 [Pontibacter actiniarum]